MRIKERSSIVLSFVLHSGNVYVRNSAACISNYQFVKETLSGMSQISLRRTISHIGPLQIAIIILAVVTALVHLDRGIMTSAMSAARPVMPPGAHPGGSLAGHRPAGGFGGPSILRYIPIPLSTLFFLNFTAYIILIVALYLPALRRFQRITRWLLILLAVVTIIAWFVITGGSPNILAYIDKPIEIALIVLLIIEDRQAARLGRG
jgi:hypothetical protein